MAMFVPYQTLAHACDRRLAETERPKPGGGLELQLWPEGRFAALDRMGGADCSQAEEGDGLTVPRRLPNKRNRLPSPQAAASTVAIRTRSRNVVGQRNH